MIYVILALLLLIFIFSAYIFFNIVKLKDLSESLNLCSVKVNELLDKKLQLIKSILKKLDDKKLNKKFIYNDEDSMLDREKNLFDIGFNINKHLKNSNNEKLNDEIKELGLVEESLDGLKDFYNANVLNYNEIFLKKYINKIYRLFKFTDYKAFKIRKLEEYEIYKN